ncbi:MAG TPA: VCBS repeat-containing protein [Chloroflexi bacterium]|nr:VCBS repeat-containing protein [Chloroflexota bacterium]
MKAGRCLGLMLLSAALVLTPRSAAQTPWQAYSFHDGAFVARPIPFVPPLPPSPACAAPSPDPWQITDCVLADVTGDGAPEWVLIVWRPWQDWPIQRWVPVPSPIVGLHDADGDSCHLILLDPRDGREIWAGSALPVPILALAVGDVDGDGRNEVVILEGDYAAGRNGLASHVDVWRWNGFGFIMAWRSPEGLFSALRLTDVDGDGILDVTAR